MINGTYTEINTIQSFIQKNPTTCVARLQFYTSCDNILKALFTENPFKRDEILIKHDFVMSIKFTF